MSHFSWKGKTLHLRCQLQPRAARDEIVGIHDDRLKVRITAAPVDGKANAHLIKFLAKQFGVPKNQVAIESGETSRQKSVSITEPRRLPTEAEVLVQESGQENT